MKKFLFICIMILSFTLFSCGTSGTKRTENVAESPDIISSLSYWEQIESEMSQYGLTGGIKILPGDDEAEVIKSFKSHYSDSCKKEELDISGDNVPFNSAYRFTVEKDVPNFWDAGYTCCFDKDIPIKKDDLIVGVMWVRGERFPESFMYEDDEAPMYYLAFKTPTDNWSTEGIPLPGRVQYAEDEWRQVFFYGYVMNDEDNSQNIQFSIFLGWGIQQIDLGGIIAYWFPYSIDNEMSAYRLVNRE